MAKKITVELVDDYDGKSKAEETVRFGVDGVEYEIDLSVKNAGKLRAAFEQWTGPGRKVGRVPKGRGKVVGRSSADGNRTAAIRDWARKNGYEVSNRGRIQANVVAAYNRAG